MAGSTGNPRRPGTPRAILTRDYVPPLSPALRWLWTPLGSLGAAAVAALLCGLILHPRGIAVLFGLLAVIALGVAWPWLALVGLEGKFRFERSRTREGEAVPVRLTLRNRMPWGAWGLVVEDDCRPTEATPTCLDHAPGWRTIEATGDFVPACRGLYPRRTPRIATGFPFGIRDASRSLCVATRLIVWPRTFEVGPLLEAEGGRCFEGSERRERAGTSGEILGVRPYRRGDSLRRIHWPQTARHDRLIVCEMQQPEAPRMQVVLDTHDDSHAGTGPGGSREWAIRVAASFLERGIEQGADVVAVFAGRVVAPLRGPVAARRLQVLDALAEIGPDGIWTLDDLLDVHACRGDVLQVVVTTDLGLRRSRRVAWGPLDRLVVLNAAAFDGGDEALPSDPPAAPSAAWIWIDDPERVPRCVRRTMKEAPLVR